jgi:hypothetical protein
MQDISSKYYDEGTVGAVIQKMYSSTEEKKDVAERVEYFFRSTHKDQDILSMPVEDLRGEILKEIDSIPGKIKSRKHSHIFDTVGILASIDAVAYLVFFIIFLQDSISLNLAMGLATALSAVVDAVGAIISYNKFKTRFNSVNEMLGNEKNLHDFEGYKDIDFPTQQYVLTNNIFRKICKGAGISVPTNVVPEAQQREKQDDKTSLLNSINSIEDQSDVASDEPDKGAVNLGGRN